ncbi:BamA/TamA family outer membrane protein [Altererythrobacter sp.]|nr:BamA/TamA family outer membrane protein [Altererythrobacter sp.]
MVSLAALALFLGTPSFAQDAAQSAQLDDLIPQEAVEQADAWASEGVPPDEPTPIDATGAPPPVEIQPDSPMAELPDLAVEWPDALELPAIEPLAPDEEVRFAELEAAPDSPLLDATIVQLNDQLALAFPNGETSFDIRDTFVNRFEALSTLEAYDGDDTNVAQLAARARADEELLQDLLRVYGFYDGQVIRTVGASVIPGADERPQVRFDIVPGPRYNFGAINLGQLDQAPDYPGLRASFGIQPGDPMSSDAIVAEQIDLDVALGETGYPFAEIDAPELLIDHDRSEGDLTLPVRPNGKYVFGRVVSSEPDFLSSEHLLDIARFEPGEVFKRSLQQDLRRAISATGLVSTVSVSPRESVAPYSGQPGIVDLDVNITQAKLRTVAGAIGYGSEEGFRVQASWEHRNFFPPEGLVRVRGIAGTQEQLAGVTFRKNNFGGRDRILTVDAYASTIDSPAFDANTAALAATYERASTLLFQKALSWSVGLELVATDERPPEVNGIMRPRETFFVAALPLYAQLDTSDSLLNPAKGFRLSGRLSPEVSRNQGVQSFYVRSRVDASIYQAIGSSTVLAGRAAFASIPGTSLANIAPSRRTYAGGGGSVRGYGFREIGPRDIADEPSGGRSLVEAAVEARIKTGFFDGALSVVPFIDAGSVSTSVTPDFEDIRVGVGVGVRYETGFGPIRVDFGVPLNPGPNDNPVAVYVSLGQAF